MSASASPSLLPSIKTTKYFHLQQFHQRQQKQISRQRIEIKQFNISNNFNQKNAIKIDNQPINGESDLRDPSGHQQHGAAQKGHALAGPKGPFFGVIGGSGGAKLAAFPHFQEKKERGIDGDDEVTD